MLLTKTLLWRHSFFLESSFFLSISYIRSILYTDCSTLFCFAYSTSANFSVFHEKCAYMILISPAELTPFIIGKPIETIYQGINIHQLMIKRTFLIIDQYIGLHLNMILPIPYILYIYSRVIDGNKYLICK